MDLFEYNGVTTYTKNSKALVHLNPLSKHPGGNIGKVTKDDIKEMMTPSFDKGKAL